MLPPMPDLIEPVDPIHANSMRAIEQIRAAVLDLKMRVAIWEPRPMPKDYHR